ncbi:class I SAM-dependent methyltransferase [Altibacter sp.]|uniref:class I SAM-dependent methyltransferase n=1 Tax=Altibacter sp. TaxID=2024823 RepID=UPI0025831E92|nr:class I SAM-dependent methyltransferase [Altibacter sp.]MCW9038316.1 class I SAM-dependent methyltransferase [Altibacter sp.]
MKDVLGAALLDYYHGNYSEDIITETNISEADALPLPYLFRSYTEMPLIEQAALKAAKGTILDIGCGAGSHALYLQQQDHRVTAIDVSEGAVKVSRLRGVQYAECTPLLQFQGATFDTLLLLMNGTGIFGTLSQVSQYLQHLKSLMAPGGQILIDSSDLQYMYDTGEEGGIWVPGTHYYGELEFTMSYKGETSEWFDWLYLDEGLFEEACTSNGLHFEIVTRGDHYDYLARLTAAE